MGVELVQVTSCPDVLHCHPLAGLKLVLAGRMPVGIRSLTVTVPLVAKLLLFLTFRV